MPPSKSRSKGSWGLIVVMCLIVSVGVFCYHEYKEAQKRRIAAAKAPVASSTPASFPVPTPMAETMPPVLPPVSAPVETPVPMPPLPVKALTTPQPSLALTKLGGRQLPLRVALTKPVTYPIVFNGQRAGEGNAPAGAMVRLLKVRSDTSLDVQYEQIAFSVPPQSTDIFDRVRKLGQYNVVTVVAPTPKFAGFDEPKPSPSAVARPAVKLGVGTLLSFDFERSVWPGTVAGACGTLDDEGSKQPSMGLRGVQSVTSGPLLVHCHESDLGKLTLAFSLSAHAARPVTVRIESFNDNKIRTGGLETLVYPAAPNFYQRYAVDLSTCKAFGRGLFEPKAAFVCFSFSLEGVPWQDFEKPTLSLDNVHYAVPAYYVSPKGSDAHDGRSENKAFATVQKALDVAEPGDIVLLMDGIHQGDSRPVASFHRTGAPAAWIVLKNYPGQKPTLSTNGWNTVSITQGSKENPSDEPALAYLEIRGLHVRNEGDVAKDKYPDAMNKSDPRTNTNGIAVDGRAAKNIPHHIRIADNLVEYCPGGGIGSIEGDWITVENNVSRCNCWTTIYATSGISVMGASNFDATENIYKQVVRNNTVYRNETFQPWAKIGRMSDGNGIILDVNQKSDSHPESSYIGRTLVQSNLSFDNGGSGIHTVRANRVDIVNNTAYLNSASKSLAYGQIFTDYSEDVRIMNNILVAPVADEKAGEKPEPVNKPGGKNSQVSYSNNVYFGGNIAPEMGPGDRLGDPHFVRPSRDPSMADFHLQSGSPALSKGASCPFSPFLDLDGRPRGAPPDAGAYQR